MIRACRPEQVRLVAEAEQTVVVSELDVAIECQRAKVREVVEAVALQACAEIELGGDAAGEEGAEDEPEPPPARQCRAGRHHSTGGQDRRHDGQQSVIGPQSGQQFEWRAARHFARAQFQRDGGDGAHRGYAEKSQRSHEYTGRRCLRPAVPGDARPPVLRVVIGSGHN